MRKTLSLILALVLAFSLAAVPAFAADTTGAETSTSATAYANGWVGGYADGTFHPNQTITRAEAVTILNRVLGRSCDLTFVQANAQAASHFTGVTPGAPNETKTPGPFVPGVFSPIHRRPCMKPSIAVAWMSPPMTRLR